MNPNGIEPEGFLHLRRMHFFRSAVNTLIEFGGGGGVEGGEKGDVGR